MDTRELKKLIADFNIPKFLIFIGEEQALIRNFLDKISDCERKFHRYYDSAAEVLAETTNSFNEDFIYVILNDQNILKNSALADELIKTNKNVILYYTDFDKKSDFYKKYSQYIVEFKKLDKYTLVAYVQKLLQSSNIDLSTENSEKLVDLCSGSMAYSLSEVDKLIALGQKSSDTLFNYIAEKNFPDYKKFNIFTTVQKLMNKDKTVLKDLLKFGDSPITLLTLLYKQAQSKLSSTNNIYYANIMRLCYLLDCMIKDGTTSDKYAVDYLLLKLF